MQDLYIVQIQPRKLVLDHAGFTAASREHELDQKDQTYIFPAIFRS